MYRYFLRWINRFYKYWFSRNIITTYQQVSAFQKYVFFLEFNL